MTTRTCLTCGTRFEDGFSLWTCSTCQQTKKMTAAIEEQNALIRQQQQIRYQPAPVITVITEEDRQRWRDNPPIPADPEEKAERKRWHRINALYKFLFAISPVVIAVLFWFITSGWYTLGAFLTIPFIIKYLYDQLWYWQIRHSDYLFGFRGIYK